MGLLGRDAAQAEEEGARAEEKHLQRSLRRGCSRFGTYGCKVFLPWGKVMEVTDRQARGQSSAPGLGNFTPSDFRLCLNPE